MSAARKYGVCIGIGIPVQWIAYFVAAFSFGPIGMAFTIPYIGFTSTTTPLPIAIIALLVSLFEGLIYGWILGGAWVRHQFVRYAIALAVVHLIVAVIAYRFEYHTFVEGTKWHM
jgi:hypothetical protein